MLWATEISAQQPQNSWQQAWQEYISMEDDDEDASATEDSYELLQELAEHPLDLNTATREEMEQLPFLSDQQVMDFMEYRDRYHALHSVGEMRMVRSMGYLQMELLPFFTKVDEPADTTHFPSLSTIMAGGRHQLSAAVRVPFYKRKGDRNGYLGYPYRHWTHYDFCYDDYIRFGLLGGQDAGEPFYLNRNQWGYDEYTYYLQIRKWGQLDNLVIGKYKLATGMGLVLNSSFALGKLAMLQNLGRQTNTLRVHASRSVADYFQGAAAIISLSKRLKLTTFASYRPVDATLNDDGSVATLLNTSYHRTPAEQKKRHNTWQGSTGADITFRQNGLSIGTTVVYTHLNRPLQPNTNSLYRRHYANGSDFINASVHYGYLHRRLAVNGETAINKEGAVATINTISYQGTTSWSIVAGQRFYSYRYTTLHGHAMSEGGRVQNEQAFFIGGNWQPYRRLLLKGYADVTHFPWARYRVSHSSTAQDYLGEASYFINRYWTLKGRYRLHLRQQDNKAKTALHRHNEHRGKLSVGYANGDWSSTTQLDAVRTADLKIENGWMLSQHLALKHGGWLAALTMGYFHTTSYDSRIYTYERQLPHTFSFPMYYGRGYRLAVVARASIGQQLQIDAKMGCTHYQDRQSTGTGLQEVDSPTMTDLDLQARWRF